MANSSAKTDTPAIVVVGSCLIDFVSYSQRFPKDGETICGKKFITNFGGKGANQCVAAARLGASTALIARLGDDMWGTRYLDNLKKEKVITEFVRKIPNIESGIAQITVTERGQSQIIIIPGANESLTSKDVEEAKKIISGASVVITQLETSTDVAKMALQLTKGISILNYSPVPEQSDPVLLTKPSILCVNETEALALTKIPISTMQDAHNIVKKLLDMGCQSVILTLGEDGCLYAKDPKQIQHFKPPEVEEVVDTTGAGDAFIGALAYMLASKDDCPINKAIEVACAVAADSVTKPGSQKSFPDKKILRKLKVI